MAYGLISLELLYPQHTKYTKGVYKFRWFHSSVHPSICLSIHTAGTLGG